MKKAEIKDSIIPLLYSILFSACLILCSIPSLLYIGNFAFKFFSSLILSSIATILFYFIFNKRVSVLGNGVCIYLALMVISALYLQIKTQLNDNEPMSKWVYIFFYDKPMTVSLVSFMVFFIISGIRLFSKISENVDEFNKFFKTTGIGLFIFFILILIYSFILIRGKMTFVEEANYIPFKIFKTYFGNNGALYEHLFYLLGNIFIFSPHGFFFRVIFPKVKFYVVILVPLIFCSFIELSQLYFQNGHCDIDDVLLNTLGFCLGVLFKYIFDKIRQKVTQGKESSIFNYQELS